MSVGVIIAAWNAEFSVGRAVASALAQPEACEIIVVDDASGDATAEAARAADDGSGRLRVFKQECNLGPSAARNLALEASRAEYVAVLDADDYLLPGRFAGLLAIPGWDAIADNVAFVQEERQGALPDIVIRDAAPEPLSLERLVAGSISRRGRPRGELGFMKPVIRRNFLDKHGLRYEETLRLSEDFMLYARMLGAGAKFLTTLRCGYVAVERANSLSGCHSTRDLAALLHTVDTWMQNAPLTQDERHTLKSYRARLSANFRHRRLLDDKREIGLPRALARLLDEPGTAPMVALRVLGDKMTIPAKAPAPAVRYLLRP